MNQPIPKYALILYDWDGCTDIVHTKRVTGLSAVEVSARGLFSFEGKVYTVEILHTSDTEFALEDNDTEWASTQRALAIDMEREKRGNGRRRYGEFLDVWPSDETLHTERNTKTTKAKRKQRNSKTLQSQRPANDPEPGSGVQQEQACDEQPGSTHVAEVRQFPVTQEGSNGRNICILYEGSGENSGVVGQPQRQPCFFEGLTTDQVDITNHRMLTSSHQSTVGCQTDKVLVIDADESIHHVLDDSESHSATVKKQLNHLRKKTDIIDAKMSAISNKLDRLFTILSGNAEMNASDCMNISTTQLIKVEDEHLASYLKNIIDGTPGQNKKKDQSADLSQPSGPSTQQSDKEATQPTVLPIKPANTEATQQDVPSTKPANTGANQQAVPPTKPANTEATQQDVPPTKPANTGANQQVVPLTKPANTGATQQDVPPTKPGNTEATQQAVPLTKPANTGATQQDVPPTKPANTEANQPAVPTTKTAATLQAEPPTILAVPLSQLVETAAMPADASAKPANMDFAPAKQTKAPVEQAESPVDSVDVPTEPDDESVKQRTAATVATEADVQIILDETVQPVQTLPATCSSTPVEILSSLILQTEQASDIGESPVVTVESSDTENVTTVRRLSFSDNSKKTPLRTVSFNSNNTIVNKDIMILDCSNGKTITEIKCPADAIPGNFEFRVSQEVLLATSSDAISQKNFMWRLAQTMYSKEELRGRNCQGRKGKQKLSPRRWHAILHAYMDTYGRSKSAFLKACEGINNGIRHLKF